MAALRLFHVEADALGSPRAVIDPARGANGSVVWRWDLAGEGFGNDKPNEDPDGDDVAFVLDMRFPGQQYDSASGLNYNYFRDYESATGRYVESDPIGIDGGINTYSYVDNGPLIWIDSHGLQATTVETTCARNPAACIIETAPRRGPRLAPVPPPSPRPTPTPAVPPLPDGKSEPCETCENKYPEFDLCSEMRRFYPYAMQGHALVDFPGGSKPRPPQPATGGECTMKGVHRTVMLNGAYVGSIYSCRCCVQTGGGPVISEIWGHNYGK